MSIKSFMIRAGRAIADHAPEILMAVGTVGVATGTVMIAKQSMHVEENLIEFADAQEDLKEHKDQFPDEKSYKKELMQIKLAAAAKAAKIYAPGAILVASGVICFFAAYGKIKKENATLAASLAAANEAFKKYRQRVIADQGEDKDKEYMYGVKKQKIQTVDENGEVKEEEAFVLEDESISRYAVRFTPEFTTEASTDINYNLMVLKACEKTWNAMLPSRKKVFLNEIYNDLGYDQTRESRRAGWDYNADKFGDGKIRFIITQIVVRDDNDPLGYHKELIVDFNVDGDIAQNLPDNPAMLGMEVDDHIMKATRVTPIE